jgi:pyridoxine kinase
MEEKLPHVLAVGSFAVHGTASLKTFITILGEKVLPVPSLLLNGLTNMSLVKKFDPPFRELLESTFELAVSRKLSLILYIGYLGKAEQAGIILEMMDKYGSCIHTVVTDPVCGDHGRTYVPQEVIAQWPSLIRRSAIVFPNITELKLLTNNSLETEESIEVYTSQFKLLYPGVKLVVTSVRRGENIGFIAFAGNQFPYLHHTLPQNYGGSGDAFVAFFILEHFYRRQPFNDALISAAEQTYNIIKNSIEKGSEDLVLQPIS